MRGYAPAPADRATRSRLDEYLVRKGHYATRSRARDAIERGTVAVDGVVAEKPGGLVSPIATILVSDPARAYVSRAALKLAAGLDHFGIDPAGSFALDLGASTGGFTQVLMERGATRVLAIDVGHNQMDARLKADPRVACREGLNARDLVAEDLGGDVPTIVVCDVSFISIVLALPPALGLAAQGALGVFLVKPQFEAGREAIGKGGLLRNPNESHAIACRLSTWLDGQHGWISLGIVASPIEGGDGNREFLLGGVKAR